MSSSFFAHQTKIRLLTNKTVVFGRSDRLLLLEPNAAPYTVKGGKCKMACVSIMGFGLSSDGAYLYGMYHTGEEEDLGNPWVFFRGWSGQREEDIIIERR